MTILKITKKRRDMKRNKMKPLLLSGFENSINNWWHLSEGLQASGFYTEFYGKYENCVRMPKFVPDAQGYAVLFDS